MGVPAGQVLCPVVVGRAAELAALDDALLQARAASGGVVLIVGEAGIGKSRLAREAGRRADAAGMRTLSGRAVETTAPIPFRPLAEAFGSALRATGPPDDASLIPYRSALRTFVPEWTEGPAAQEFAPLLALEGVVRLLRVLASDRAIMITLEDLHWADSETLGVVEYLADNLRDEPAVCICTIRSDERSPALEMAERLAARRGAARLEIGRLSGDAVGEMARASLDVEPPAPLLRVLRERTDGVPFLIEELLSAYLAAGGPLKPGAGWPGASQRAALALPASYRDLTRSRLEKLDRQGRAVVDAAALLGPAFEWTLIPRITGLASDEVLDSLRAAAAVQLITTGHEDGFRFRHALVPETILGELLPPERAELSRRAAEAIEATYPGLPGDWCERAADLRETAGDVAGAATHLMEAGTRALRKGAIGTAEELLERARAMIETDRWHRMGVDRLLIDVLAQAGKTARIRDIGASLLDFVVAKSSLYAQASDARTLAPMHARIARALAAAQDWPAARGHLDRAAGFADQTKDAPLILSIRALEARTFLGEGDLPAARAAAENALNGAEESGLTDVVCEALMILGEESIRRGSIAEAVEVFERTRLQATDAGAVPWIINALLELGAIEMWTSPTGRLLQARDLAADIGAVSSQARAEHLIGWTHLLRFELDAASDALERSADLGRRFQLPLLPESLIAFAYLHATRGDSDPMEKALAEAEEVDPAAVAVQGGAPAARGFLALMEERRDDAVAWLERATEPDADATGVPLVPALLLLLKALDGNDATTPEIPASWAGLPLNATGLELVRCVALGRDGVAAQAAQAAGRFQSVDATLEPFPLYRHLTRRLVAEAAVRDGWGSPGEWLRETAAFFSSAGLDRVADACKALMRKAGVPVPRKGRGTSTVPPALHARGLTSREVDVLKLAAAGHSNRLIAEQLFLSPRTIETHLANIVRKLGMSGRAELIAFARETFAT